MDGSESHNRFRGTAENAKTKLCLRWEAGNCRFGERCNFAHGEHELRRLPPRSGMNRGGFSRSDGPSMGAGGPPGGAYFTGSTAAYTTGGRPAGGLYNGGFAGGQYGAGQYGGQAQYGGPLGNNSGGGGSGGGSMGYSPGMGGGGGGYGLAQQQQQQQQHGGGDQWGGGGGGGGYVDQMQGGAVPGTNSWIQYTTADGQKYYHHAPTDMTQWEVPDGWMPLQ